MTAERKQPRTAATRVHIAPLRRTAVAMTCGAALAVVAGGCGDGFFGASSETDTTRDASVRDLPGRVAPADWRPDASIDSGLRDDFFADFDAGPCCDVDFALAAQPGEVFARLRGTAAPLDAPDGVVLDRAEGAWRTTVCMPPDYDGVYYYEVYLLPDSGEDAGVDATPEPLPAELVEATELFESRRHNDAVLTETDAELGTVNLFRPADACDDSGAGRHGSTGNGANGDMDAGR